MMSVKHKQICIYVWLYTLFFVLCRCAPMPVKVVDVKGFIADGQLNQARVYCEQLTGPEQKDCFYQLSQAYVNARDFESAVCYDIKAHEENLFLEDFNDNRNGWFETDDADVFRKVQDSRYIFSQKREKGIWLSWPQIPINLNEEKDFKIEAVMTKMEGIDNHSYEVVWGLKDSNNYYAFGVSGNGSFLYSKINNGKWEYQNNWISSNHINKFNASNVLAVQKTGRAIRFFINNQQVLKKPYECAFGPKVGICLNNRMKVAVDRFTVTQMPTEEQTYQKLLEARLIKGDFMGFINYCEKAGYTRNEAYVHVAEVHMTNGDYEAAAMNLQQAGWSVTDLKEKIVFNEQFNNNKNKWFEQENTEICYKVQNGQYHFDHKRDNGGWFSWPQALVNIDESGDFRIESTMSKISGVENHAYEIFWGMKDTGNCYIFGISANGRYLYGKYEQGRWKTLMDWTESAHINRGNLTNTLAVEKSGDKIKFYINAHFITERPYEKQFGQRIGFMLNNKMAVEIDNLTVTQYAPKVAHALALKYMPPGTQADKQKSVRKDLRRQISPVETPTKR